MRNAQLVLSKAAPNFPEQGCERRLLRGEIEFLDASCKQIFAFRIQEAGSSRGRVSRGAVTKSAVGVCIG